MRTLTIILLLALAVQVRAADPAEDKAARNDRFAALKAEAQPYMTFGDQVMELLAKGDGDAVKERMSPSAVKRNGTEKLNEFFDTKLMPYFAKYDKLDGDLTSVARTADKDGHKGFVIQYVFFDKEGTRRPLVMYILIEDEKYVVANIVPGRSLDEASRVKQ